MRPKPEDGNILAALCFEPDTVQLLFCLPPSDTLMAGSKRPGLEIRSAFNGILMYKHLVEDDNINIV